MLMISIKAGLRRLVRAVVSGTGATRVGRVAYEGIIDDVMARTQSVSHNGVQLMFVVPNAMNRFRVDTFATKEPETLRWIDDIPEGSDFWDIGANVGLYTCYAGKARRCRVFAFEPSVFNLELLARNIFLNDLIDRATIVPLPLAARRAVSRMQLTSTQWGGALSTFGESFGFDGKPIRPVFEFSTIGLSMADACVLLDIPQPDYIKMDVDGIEHLILSGGESVLRKARGVLIEINEQFDEQVRTSSRILQAAGFRLRDKQRWADAVSDADSPFASTYNQIWFRE